MQAEEAVFPRLRAPAAAEIGGRRTQYQGCLILMASKSGDIPGMVTGIRLGAVAVLLLFIHQDQAEILYGSKHRTARADDKARSAPLDTLPLVTALAGGKAAVHDGNLVAEPGAETGKHLRRQGDLRYKQDRALSLLQAFCNQVGVNAGFAASGHAGEQRNPAFTAAECFEEALKDRLLLVIQRRQGHSLHTLCLRTAEDLLLKDLDEAKLTEPIQRRAACAGMREEIGNGKQLKAAEQIQDLRLSGGAPAPFPGICGSLVGGNRKPDQFQGRIPVPAFAAFIQPEAGREHGAQRLIDGAEIALAHEVGELQLFASEKRFLIGNAKDLLAVRIAAFLRQGKNKSLGDAVSAAEGHENAGARNDAVLQAVGNPIVIGTVDRNLQGGKSHTGKHGSFAFRRSAQRMVSFPVYTSSIAAETSFLSSVTVWSSASAARTRARRATRFTS